MILTHLVLFSFLNGAGGTVTPVIPVPPSLVPGAGDGGARKRRYIVKADGTRIYPKSDADFRRIVADIIAEQQAEDFPKAEAPIKRKPGPKPKVEQTVYIPPVTERWNTLFAQLADIESQAITESMILLAAQVALQMQDEDDVLTLLLN